MAIKAKFVVVSILNYGNAKEINMRADTTVGSEDFSPYTPNGSFNMTVIKDTVAFDYFNPGDKVYVTFDKAD